MKQLLLQIIKFGFVGGLCFLIDYGLLVFMTEILKIHYLLSAGISFTVSVIVNYYLSMRYVFKNFNNFSKKLLFAIFIVLSVSGLLINQLLMYLLVDKLSLYYMYSKIFVTVIVMIYNFVTRKLILESKINNK